MRLNRQRLSGLERGGMWNFGGAEGLRRRWTRAFGAALVLLNPAIMSTINIVGKAWTAQVPRGTRKRRSMKVYDKLTPTGQGFVEWLVDGRTHLEPYTGGAGWTALSESLDRIEGLLARIPWLALTSDSRDVYGFMSPAWCLVAQAAIERLGYRRVPRCHEQAIFYSLAGGPYAAQARGWLLAQESRARSSS